VQQIALDQRRTEFGFQSIALQFLARRWLRRQGCLASGEKCITPAAQRRRRDTETARDGLKVLAPQQSQHRCGFALPRHPATPAGRRCAGLLRSLRIARPRCNVLLLIHLTPLRRKSSAYEVSQSTV
jgi:hypothetical protein